MTTATYPLRVTNRRSADQRGIRLCVYDDVLGWIPLPAEMTSPPPEVGAELAKWCLDHRRFEPVSAFYLDRAKADGYGSYCAEAMKDRVKRRYMGMG